MWFRDVLEQPRNLRAGVLLKLGNATLPVGPRTGHLALSASLSVEQGEGARDVGL